MNTVSEVIANNGQVPISMGGTALASTQTDMMNATTASSSSSASGGQRTNTTSASGGGGAFSSGSNASSPNKLPCEDATLEFSGYDNFALKVSPVLGKTMIGTADLFQQFNAP